MLYYSSRWIPLCWGKYFVSNGIKYIIKGAQTWLPSIPIFSESKGVCCNTKGVKPPCVPVIRELDGRDELYIQPTLCVCVCVQLISSIACLGVRRTTVRAVLRLSLMDPWQSTTRLLAILCTCVLLCSAVLSSSAGLGVRASRTQFDYEFHFCDRMIWIPFALQNVRGRPLPVVTDRVAEVLAPTAPMLPRLLWRFCTQARIN